jgi:beta-glucosidase
MGRHALEAGQRCDLEVRFAREGRGLAALKIGCLAPIPDDSVARAAGLASACDAAVVIIGLNRDWETEGNDRRDMELPGAQNELIERVAAANPNTAVVVNCGAPVRMPWIDDVASVLQVWYGGQEAGNALADILFGDQTPSGKLPTTFPRRLEDTPAFVNYPGENGEVLYGEGVFVGYRYYDTKRIEPLFPFGHGLSYTTFAYGDLVLSEPQISSADLAAGRVLAVSVTVENTGSRPGAEVVQLYVRDIASRLARPDKELRAFEKVELAPGTSAEIQFSLDERDLAFYDPADPGWVTESGEFEILVGSSSRDIRASASFRVSAG